MMVTLSVTESTYHLRVGWFEPVVEYMSVVNKDTFTLLLEQEITES